MSAEVEPTIALDVASVPAPDLAAEPTGFVVEVAPGDRIHFLDWGGPVAGPGVLLIHGLAQTAFAWTPVARRLRSVARIVAMDLRGHGLSDAPTEGFDADTFADDVVAVVEGSGLLADEDAPPIVIAGHGFGAIVAAWAAARLGARVGGLVLVDGGWENLAETTEMDPDEFLRGLEEPPEVLRSMDAFLADRRDFDPSTWDVDQEAAARATVVEQHSKRLTPVTRPHVVAGSVGAIFTYDPLRVLPSVEAPILALAAADDDEGTSRASLIDAQRALAGAGRSPVRVVRFPDAGHNLMRYRPRQVSAAILASAGTIARP
jgi:pimeloyl-ACP methyl ester carboxylesterase